MNIDNVSFSEFPFKHWELSECLDSNALNEISYSNIPEGNSISDATGNGC